MALKLFFEVLIFLLIVWVVWVFLGGPARYEATHNISSPFIHSPAESHPLAPYGPTVQ